MMKEKRVSILSKKEKRLEKYTYRDKNDNKTFLHKGEIVNYR